MLAIHKVLSDYGPNGNRTLLVRHPRSNLLKWQKLLSTQICGSFIKKKKTFVDTYLWIIYKKEKTFVDTYLWIVYQKAKILTAVI